MTATEMRVQLSRSLAACVWAWAALAAGAAAAQQPIPPSAPLQQMAPPEDPARLEMEARLKRLQRAEIAATDSSERATILREIIDLMIELDRDYTPYEQKLKQVEEALGKEETAANQQRRRELLNVNLKARARQAMTAVPPRWVEAVQLLEAAGRLDPKDAETIALKAHARRGVRDVLVYRVALGLLLGLIIIGVVVGAYKAIRRGGGARQLEMLEGPQPGDTFPLEKEKNALGSSPAEADWVIEDPSRRVSRRHCEISRSGRRYYLLDCSSNGTLVNGKPAPRGEPVLLRRGALISLAENIVLRFR